jgi:hypothetical protein
LKSLAIMHGTAARYNDSNAFPFIIDACVSGHGFSKCGNFPLDLNVAVNVQPLCLSQTAHTRLHGVTNFC